MANSHQRRPRGFRATAVVTALIAASAGLVACGDDGEGADGRAVLNWYVNPDGQEVMTQLAKDCSTDKYEIATQFLPSSATDQRTQLARRLAAEDSSTDLMSLDPVFIPEFASAGWLTPFTGDLADKVMDDVLDGPASTAVWEDEVVAAPQWANTQVLWYRKSLAVAAGLDMSKPVTWEQIIKGAADNGATVGVQGNKYEGYMAWINALVLGAGGEIVTDTEAGRDAKVEIDSEAGKAAATVIQRLADSKAAQPDLSVSNEGTSTGFMFPPGGGPGEFMVNWTFAYSNYAETPEKDDLGWARYPATVEGEESRPPIGGISIGVGAYGKHTDLAQDAALCLISADTQKTLAVDNGMMPVASSVYEAEELAKAYPKDLLNLWRESIENGGPRPSSPFYSQISGAIQSTWHPPNSVNPNTTPRKSAEFLSDVLQGKRLL